MRQRSRVQCKCACCGLEFEVKTCRAAKGGGKYCSRECSDKCKPTRKHGEAGGREAPAEYRIWLGIKARCFTTSNNCYPHYGEVGITMCQLWKNDYLSFLADVGRRPTSSHSIDRFPNQSGHYSCGHCPQCVVNGWSFNVRWATGSEQCRNTRGNRMLTFNGETHCVTEWAEIKGISRDSLYQRIGHGWDVVRILTTPQRITKRTPSPIRFVRAGEG